MARAKKSTKEEFMDMLREKLEELGNDCEGNRYDTAKPIKFKSEAEAIDHIQNILRCRPGTRMIMHTTDGDKEVVFWRFDDEVCRALVYYPVLNCGYTRSSCTVACLEPLEE